ncbi:barstar family protein [Brenneria izadpanahii]|uniref:Barstar family protein n=1 Tax=Brenneria izadpanahii TaxID=2722756 RepID=A0ABX7UU39_9GAMM|nr:barstar family protein [Brenneria izadpanahii]QTF07882.1 barstar family protein [Brenneria izadpanahii]
MKLKKLSIDFSYIKTDDDFHNAMKVLFGFPDFYGMNFNAFNDCLNSLRYPEDGMSSIHLKKDEYLLLEVKKIDLISDELRYNFLLSIKAINYGSISFGDDPLIYLLFD